MDLETIYQAYPRKKDKRFALMCIDRALRRIQSGETGRKMTSLNAHSYLLEKVCEFSRSPAGNQGQMTPYPATWMNRGAYMDDQAEWEKAGYQVKQTDRDMRNTFEANIGVWRPQ